MPTWLLRQRLCPRWCQRTAIGQPRVHAAGRRCGRIDALPTASRRASCATRRSSRRTGSWPGQQRTTESRTATAPRTCPGSGAGRSTRRSSGRRRAGSRARTRSSNGRTTAMAWSSGPPAPTATKAAWSGSGRTLAKQPGRPRRHHRPIDVFPNAAEAALLAAMPEELRGTCQRGPYNPLESNNGDSHADRQPGVRRRV